LLKEQGNSGAIDYKALNDAAGRIKPKIEHAIGLGADEQYWFPSLHSDAGSAGMLVVLTKERHPASSDASPGSTRPSSSWSRRPGRRSSQARCWIRPRCSCHRRSLYDATGHHCGGAR
jgi:hypothetical protein